MRRILVIAVSALAALTIGAGTATAVLAADGGNAPAPTGPCCKA